MLRQRAESLALILTVILLVVGVLGYSGTDSIKEHLYSAKAAVSDNVSGYAWSENIGWISFNNTSGGGGTNYGVKIDALSGDFSGYAWSENIGWISFNRVDTGDPPSAPFNDGSGPIARYNLTTREITGWARVLANGNGWDGWIRFCDSSVPKCSAANQIAKIDTSGDWQGWAWSDIVAGWINLNCASQGNCGVSNYKVQAVTNRAPIATNLSVTSIADSNYCTVPSHKLSWTYSDQDNNPESKFQLQIDNNNDFSSPEIDRTINLIVESGDNNSQQAQVSVPVMADKLTYGEITYYWRVKVWDSHSLSSSWINGASFKTAKHAFPVVNFKAFPVNPSMNEVVQLTDLTTGVVAITSWTWIIPDVAYQDNTTVNSQNPKVKFTATGTKNINLAATDIDGYQCFNTDTSFSLQNIKVKLRLPGWEETGNQ